MRKILAALAAVMCVTLAGCEGDSVSSFTGNTEIEPLTSSAPLTEPVGISSGTDGAQSVTEEITPPESENPDFGEILPDEPTADIPQTEDTPAADVTKQISAFDNTYLGLPSADKVYIFSDAGKSADIDGYTCSAASCYDEYEGTLYYMCDFYISPDGSRVYRYYEQEQRFAILPEEQMTRLDPTRQSLDEIFTAATNLYMMFHPSTNAMVEGIDYESAPKEINGEMYIPVTSGQINSKAVLLDALDRYFSAEIVTALMDTNKFMEGDGILYVKDCTGAGPNPSLIGIAYELTELNENSAVFTEYDTFQYEAGESEVREIVYTAEKQNGVWHFTDFTAPWTVR